MTMICDLCGRDGIRWIGPLSNLTHTECPHCGGTNCQRVEHDEPSEEADDNFREAWKLAIMAFDEARWHGDDDAFDSALRVFRSVHIGARFALAKEIAPEIAAASDARDAKINGFIEQCEETEKDLVRCGNHRAAAIIRAAIGAAQFCVGVISDADAGAAIGLEKRP